MYNIEYSIYKIKLEIFVENNNNFLTKIALSFGLFMGLVGVVMPIIMFVIVGITFIALIGCVLPFLVGMWLIKMVLSAIMIFNLAGDIYGLATVVSNYAFVCNFDIKF